MFNEAHRSIRFYKNFIISIYDYSLSFLYNMVDRIYKKTYYCSEYNGISSEEERQASCSSFIKMLIYNLKYL
jgi:hypothetical protein